MDEVSFQPVTSANWADFERLFEASGGPGYCWCMVWRDAAGQATPTIPAERKACLQSLVGAGVPVGILGYDAQRPVAWCSVAPRSAFQKSLAPLSDCDAEGSVWSLTCFYVARAERGKGLFALLLKAAEKEARLRGAAVLEAYPVDPEAPSYRFSGFLPAFVRAGYHETGRVGSRRHLVRKSLADGGPQTGVPA